MQKPRILVLTAAGKTGGPIAQQLLKEGFPVTALVHREDARSERLRSLGAQVVVGSLTDVEDMRKALRGVRRAYFCAPVAEGYLRAAAVFAAVAAEQRLETVVALSQWLASPGHPTPQTRETWLADQLFALLPETGVTTINVGWFADNDMLALATAAQFGLLTMPYGEGRNAPISNEDIAAVAAGILSQPDGHAGRTYRPTGPKLLSGDDIAEVFSRVLGRKVRYIDTPVARLQKVLRGIGVSAYEIAQIGEYFQEYRKGTFAAGAPTDVVRAITGREPEDFETIARRYAAATPAARPSLRAKLTMMTMMAGVMLRPGPQTAWHLRESDFSRPEHITLSADSPEWRRSHDLTRSHAPLTTVPSERIQSHGIA